MLAHVAPVSAWSVTSRAFALHPPAGKVDVRTRIVHTARMRNVTISADEAVLRQARNRARAEHRTLNELVREWMAQYIAQPAAGDTYDALMQRMSHVAAGRRFSREELHERH